MPRMLVAAALLLLAAAAGGCSHGVEQAARADRTAPARPFLSDSFVRSPHARTGMDTNPANLASAVVTYNFGLLPRYIDEAAFLLLPHDLKQTSQPGRTLRHAYRLTVPRTRLVLDAAVTTAPTASEARELARAFTVAVSLDGRYVRDPKRFWVFYRNNGPEICRIYFPGDLGSLHMGAASLVFQPLAPGVHHLRVELRHRIVESLPAARLVSDYELRVLSRGPTARERAIAPPEDSAPPANDRTPLSFRSAQT